MIEVEGKTLDEALRKAEAIMQVPREKLKYEYNIEKTVLYGPPSKKKIVIKVEKDRRFFNPEISPFLEELKDKSGFNIDFEFEEEKDKIKVIVSGKDSQYFSRNNGELINSLQHILNKVFSEKLGKHIICDIRGGFRKKRKEFLKRMLVSLLKKHRNKNEIFLPPLNPVDRMMVHTMAEDMGLKTESLGEGYFKKIKVIKGE